MLDQTISLEQLERAANILKAISHPIRIAILNHLDQHEKLTVTEIHEKLGIEQSTTSHHLGILRDKGVLNSKRDGKNTFYSLKSEKLNSLIACINTCACE